jgi:FkbM family methyltransferase
MDLVVTEIPKKVPKICLNMIVKDESHIIEDTLTKLLNKVKIDYWVISDTGSTDKTKETIVEFFRKKNIKGELFEDKWENFGYNRTKALEHAYKKSEYVLIFDADDEICGDFIVPELKYDLYNFQFGSPNGVSYIRPQLVNNNKIWKYNGVLHEFITCIENNHTSAIITGNYYTVSGRTSNRNKDSNKYLKDALILEKAYEDAVKNGDEIYSRYGFYCANSYYDCGKHEEAIKWFKITLANKNWEQEKYVSCLRLYKCYNSLNQKETGMFYLIKAFSYDKERVECLYELVLHYCLDGMNDVAYSYYNIVKSFHNDKYLKRDLVGKLFVDVGIAELYLPYYMILVSDKVGDHETTIQMYRIIFTKKFIESNKFFIGNMLYNLQFFIERVKDDKTFINLFNEYINFLISIDYPIHDHEFMNLYEKYGVVLPKISNQIFSNEVCMESKNILFYTGYSPIKWNHTYGSNNALGGSETAIISLSSNFPKEYKVYISGDVEEETVDNITYINMNNLHNLIKMTAFHTIIVSRYLNFYEIYKNFSAYQTFIWGHDIALFPYGTNLSVESILQKWSSKITGCICQTEWHKNLFISTYPQLNNKITVINNGVNNNMFTQHTRKVNNRFIYTSCTERGLDRLLEIWPLLTKEIPDAELFISSYNNFPINSNEVVLKNIIDSYPNVEHLGKLNKNDLYELMSTAEYWLYPTNFNETSCITAMEMLMSEVICIYYPIAGLVYTLGDYGIPVQRGNEIETILELTTKNKNEIKKRGKEYAISCSWENRANNWIKLINIENKKNQVVFDSNKYSTVTESNSINKNINLSNEEKRIFELYETISMPESHNRILKNISKTFTPKVIYNIGASTLHWTKEVKKIWNDVEIIAFDAIQEAEELYKSQNVKYNIGVLSDQDNKVVNFYENKENPAGNSYYRENGHPNSINIYPENSYKEKVSKTLTTVVKERLFSLPELIKIDVQGAELDILKGGQEIISNAKYLIIELQNIEYNKGAPLANITIDFLIENGWEIVESKFSDNGPDADYLFVNTNYDSIMKNKINIDNTKLDMWKNLNIEPYYNFPVSKNWFGYSEIKKYLLNNIDLTKQYNILEIGSFEGCSSCFFSDILINNSLSTLTCVDPFVSDGCTKTDNSTLKYKFYSNIKKTENYNKINVVEKISDDFYSTYNGSKFNFIYIDGEHSDKQILKDLDACFSLLDINGIIWCDDYNNNWKHTFDSWILLKNDYINIIHSGYQLGFIKIKETKIQKNTINNTEIVNNTGIINFKKLAQNIVINNAYYYDNKIEYDIRENKIDITYSQAHQDIFVTSLLQHKKNGYFVEIGTNDPIECNNTYLLEKNYNFKGLLVEYESYYKNKYEQHRPNSIYIIDDARNINYKKVLDDNKFPKNIDYLQIDLDVDNKSTLDTLILLDNTVFDTYKFSTITFEHDYYRGNFFNTREISREIFKKRGYLLVFPDVCTDQGCVGTGWQPFEDWYVHPDLVDMNLVNIIKTDKSLRNDHIKNILINNSSITSNNCNKSKKMKVIFSNNCSVGDIYFSQPFIKNIVENNPDNDYYIYHQTCSYYFTDILKIKDVNKIPELKELLYQVFNFKINLYDLVNIQNMSSYVYRYDKTNNILLICTWLGCIRNKYPMLECNMISYNNAYKLFINDINKDLNFDLKYNDELSLDVYPSVPILDIKKYREFKDKNFNKNIIFYYNFLPSSGQSYPVKNYDEHNEIIKNLSENNIVVIPHKQSYKGNTDNVYFADDFLENVEYYDAKNFYYHAQMAYESDYSIYYDLGRGFMSMNKKFIEENNCNIRLHITNNEYFYNSLNNNLLVSKNYMNLIKVNNYIDIINELNKVIKYNKFHGGNS